MTRLNALFVPNNHSNCHNGCLFFLSRHIASEGDVTLTQSQKYVFPSPAQSRRSKPLGLACAACFEQIACVFASCGAML